MNAAEVLRDPGACLSAVWSCLAHLLPGSSAWEVETLRIELERRSIPWTEALGAKVLGAQTVTQTRAWSFDHDVLFQFCLACDGIPASSAAIVMPTALQLAWGVDEIRALTELPLGEDDDGFDADTIDPGIAVILHDDGWVVVPDQLAFAQDALSRLDVGEDEALRARVEATWGRLRGLPSDEVRRIVSAAPEDALRAQVARLADVSIETRALAERRRSQSHAGDRA